MSSNDDIFTSEHYEAIGRLIVTCSRLEAILTDMICLFADLHVINGIVIVHHQQFSSKHDSLLALMRRNGCEEDHPLFSKLKSAKAIYDYRSSLVHSMWSKSESGQPLSVRFSARGAFKRSRVERPTQEILLKAQEGSELADELAKLRDYLLSTSQSTELKMQSDIPPSRLG